MGSTSARIAREAAAARNNAQILCARYTGGQYAFFFGDQRRTYFATVITYFAVMQKMVHWTLRKISKRTFHWIWPQGVNPLFSPYSIAV